MRLKGAVNTIDKYTAPATRAALLVGCMDLLVDCFGLYCRGRRCLPREAVNFPYKITRRDGINGQMNQSGPR